MKGIKAARIGAIVVLGALAGLVVMVLYRGSAPIPFQHHLRTVESIRRAEGLDASIQRTSLSIRFGLLRQYDALTAELASLEEAVDRIDEASVRVLGEDVLSSELESLRQSVRERRTKSERFKSQAAVFRNSLYYLPAAGEHLEVTLERALQGTGDATTGEDQSALLTLVRSVVKHAIVYNLLGGKELHARLERSVLDLEAKRSEVPEGAVDEYDLFLRHSRIVTDQLEVVDGLLDEIRGTSVSGALRAVDRSYGEHVASRMETANRYRTALYAWSVFLLFVALFIGWKLRQFYARLDALVRERTRELRAAMEELWGEMQLARKIQTALLPKEPRIDGCDVAATMEPAEQVGGDYYDVFTVGDRDWILVGDVSGHGVPSGLIMMMCQTAVRTAVEANPDVTPARLLEIVNEPITQDIRRLGESRYITCTALVRTPDQRIQYSGMHQDLLVYRASTKTVESIEPEGVWLGLKEDISGMLTNRELQLEQGDALLLYTDGMTEARRDGKLVGVEALASVLLTHGDEGAQSVLDALIAQAKVSVVADDMAAIVVKRRAAA